MNKNRILLALIAAFAAITLPAAAQKPGVTGGTVVASTPGKAVITSEVEVTATVMAIDKANRTVTLKGPKQTVDVVAGPEVRNFDQIHVGDLVVVKYERALSLPQTLKAESDTNTGSSVEHATQAAGFANMSVVSRPIWTESASKIESLLPTLRPLRSKVTPEAGLIRATSSPTTEYWDDGSGRRIFSDV